MMAEAPRVLLRLRTPERHRPEFVITIDGQSYVRPLSLQELRTMTEDFVKACMRYPIKEAQIE
jgi:hypothetical protein